MSKYENLPANALLLAAAIRGDRNEEIRQMIDEAGLERETALAEAGAFMTAHGIKDRETYLAFRNALRAELRDLAAKIRVEKTIFRMIDGNHADYWTHCKALRELRRDFQLSHDARRLSKAWAGVQMEEARAAAAA
ncbi:hypothetical protein ACEUZ9_004133 [Paracoccus litorisediminis]|uniref:hypothetical protein n=1 Tax=Paracoccus litorisediminis TaxID=2006130 RepID=UPI00373212B7